MFVVIPCELIIASYVEKDALSSFCKSLKLSGYLLRFVNAIYQNQKEKKWVSFVIRFIDGETQFTHHSIVGKEKDDEQKRTN